MIRRGCHILGIPQPRMSVLPTRIFANTLTASIEDNTFSVSFDRNRYKCESLVTDACECAACSAVAFHLRIYFAETQSTGAIVGKNLCWFINEICRSVNLPPITITITATPETGSTFAAKPYFIVQDTHAGTYLVIRKKGLKQDESPLSEDLRQVATQQYTFHDEPLHAFHEGIAAYAYHYLLTLDLDVSEEAEENLL
jgi:hypothetical protein